MNSSHRNLLEANWEGKPSNAAAAGPKILKAALSRYRRV